MVRNGMYAQGLDEISASLKDPLGEPRWEFGNKYKMSQNSSAGALRLGEILIRDPSEATTHYSFDDVATNTVVDGEYAIKQVISVTAGDTIVAGEFAGLDVYVDLSDTGHGEGQTARIKTNDAAVVSGTCKIYLTAVLTTALTAAGHSDITIIPRDIVTEAIISDAKQDVIGLAQLAVTASYFFWRQVAGIGPMFIGDTSAHNSIVSPGDDTAGQVLIVGGGVTVEDAVPCGRLINGCGTADTLAYAQLMNMDS